MYVLPPVENPLIPAIGSVWLPPIRFALKPYIELCQVIDQSLGELEAKYPSKRAVLTLEARNKRMRRRPK